MPKKKKKRYHFHSNEVRSGAAPRRRLPVDHYANSRIDAKGAAEMGRQNKSYWLVQSGPDSRRMLRVSQSQVFVGARSQMSFSAAIWPLWAAQRQQHLLSQPLLTPFIFRVNGPSQGRSLTCNSPLMSDISAACVSISGVHNGSI